MTAAQQREGTVFTVLGAISLGHFLNDMIQSLIPAIYPILKDSYHLDFTKIGLITLTYQLTASLLQPLIGHFTDLRLHVHARCWRARERAGRTAPIRLRSHAPPPPRDPVAGEASTVRLHRAALATGRDPLGQRGEAVTPARSRGAQGRRRGAHDGRPTGGPRHARRGVPGPRDRIAPPLQRVRDAAGGRLPRAGHRVDGPYALGAARSL